MLPISEACERNKVPILSVLKRVFSDRTSALEIGSGTGQHAAYFAENLPHLNWQSADFGNYLSVLSARISDAGLSNLPLPIELDVRKTKVDQGYFDAVFSANTLHIMSASAVENFFQLVGQLLPREAPLVIYGPFNYAGNYSSPSNRSFDDHLRSQNPESAIRDFEWVDSLANAQGLELKEDIKMPSNNQCLVWQKNS